MKLKKRDRGAMVINDFIKKNGQELDVSLAIKLANLLNKNTLLGVKAEAKYLRERGHKVSRFEVLGDIVENQGATDKQCPKCKKNGLTIYLTKDGDEIFCGNCGWFEGWSKSF